MGLDPDERLADFPRGNPTFDLEAVQIYGAISASLPLDVVQRPVLGLATFTWAMRLFWSSLARGISCKKYLFIMVIVNTQPAVLAGKMSANAFMPGTKM